MTKANDCSNTCWTLFDYIHKKIYSAQALIIEYLQYIKRYTQKENRENHIWFW